MLKLLLHGVGSCEPGALIGPACWPHHDLIVVLEGKVGFLVGARALECVAGDALLIPPGQSFEGRAGVDGAAIWVQHFLSRGDGALGLPRSVACWRGVAQWEWSRTLMRRLSYLQKKRGEVLSDKKSGLLLALLLEEFKASRVSPPADSAQTILLVIDWIEHHVLPLPSLRKIAAFAGWSVNYFRDQFRAVNGQTVGAFLKQRRMGEAARLLIETRRPIKEIAVLAGYAEVASFHRAFLLRYQVTPGDYRRQKVLAI